LIHTLDGTQGDDMSLASEFKAFALKGNVLDLAVGVVIGGAFGKIVTAIVEGLIMPLVGALLPGGDWRELTVTPLDFKLGSVLGATIDFVIVAFVLFIVASKLLATKKAAPPPPATKTCKQCLETIPVAALRCRACASSQD
jgi:large conductance mechanosensitive channel